MSYGSAAPQMSNKSARFLRLDNDFEKIIITVTKVVCLGEDQRGRKDGLVALGSGQGSHGYVPR